MYTQNTDKTVKPLRFPDGAPACMTGKCKPSYYNPQPKVRATTIIVTLDSWRDPATTAPTPASHLHFVCSVHSGAAVRHANRNRMFIDKTAIPTPFNFDTFDQHKWVASLFNKWSAELTAQAEERARRIVESGPGLREQHLSPSHIARGTTELKTDEVQRTWVSVYVSGYKGAESFTPAQARELAERLLSLADEAEAATRRVDNVLNLTK